MSRADRSRPRAITRLCLIAAAAVAVFVGACSVDEAMPAPTCSGDTSALLAAQSVPTASEIPCLEPLPDGWLVASVSINQDRTVVKLDSDRAGTDAAVLRLEKECDVAEAVTAPSDIPSADRYDQIDRLEPSFRASRYYVFPGGCVWWRFDFDRGASATEAVAIGDVLALVSRQAFNDSFRESFVDEDI